MALFPVQNSAKSYAACQNVASIKHKSCSQGMFDISVRKQAGRKNRPLAPSG